MTAALQVLTVILVAIAMGLPVAHALELPGKLRLSKEQYLVVQPIYYPGFTIGGVAEPLALISMIMLLSLTPTGSVAFWLIAGAFAALLVMHAAYWLPTHPVNNFWLKDFKLAGAGAAFFSFQLFHRNKDASRWTHLRDQWEFSRALRAALGMVSLILLTIAVTLFPAAISR